MENQSVKLEVTLPPQERKSLKTGNTYRLQSGYVHLPNQRYPAAIEWFVGGNSAGLAVGMHELDLASTLEVRQGRLVLGDFRVVQPAPKVAAVGGAK